MTAMKKMVEENHELHLATDKDTFIERFADRCGVDPITFIERCVDADSISAIILGGSIPLRTATGASDVDFIVLTRDGARYKDHACEGAEFDEDQIFSASYSHALNNLKRETLVQNVDGVEVDVDLIELSSVLEISALTNRSEASLTSDHVRILSRIKTGWLLHCAESSSEQISIIQKDRALSLRTAVSNMRNAIKAHGHARAAVATNPDVSVYLARASLEWAFMSVLSALGCAYPGEKWLLILERNVAGDLDERRIPSELYRTGVDLLFPKRMNDTHDVECYLKNVGGWINQVRRWVELDPTNKLANAFCKQIYDLA